MDTKTYMKGCLYVVLSAVIFGCMPLGALTIYAGGGNAVSLVFYRNLLPLPILLLLTRAKGEPVKPPKELRLSLVVAALFQSVTTPVLLFSAYNYISSGMATTLHFIYPVTVLLGCALFFGDRITPIKALCVLLCTGGIVCLYSPEGGASMLGILLAAGSGLTYTVYIILLGKSRLRDIYPFRLSMYIAACGTPMLLVYALLTGTFVWRMTPKAWLLTIIMALCVTVGAVVLFQMGTKLVGPQRASILSTLEPITSIVIGILWLGESFDLKSAFGVLLILVSVVALTLFDRGREVPAGTTVEAAQEAETAEEPEQPREAPAPEPGEAGKDGKAVGGSQELAAAAED